MDENKERNLAEGNPQMSGQVPEEGVGQAAEWNYGQNYQQTYNPNYGQPNVRAGAVPLGKNGKPLKNNYGMKLTFSILEVLCCCGCNIVTMILGILGGIFSSQANTAYKAGRWEEFRSKSKTATILLWIGGVLAAVALLMNILLWTVGGLGKVFTDAFTQEMYTISEEAYEDAAEKSVANSMIETAPGIQTQKEKAQEPVDVTPGDGFTDPTITVNGFTVTFPLTYAELVEAGFYIDTEDEDYVINKNEYHNPTLYDANGTELGAVYIGNETERPLAMKDGTVFGFDINSYNLEYEGVTFSLPNGLNQNATADDFKEAFGEPDYEYESDSYDSQNYQWYNHSAVYYDTEENSISVSFWDGAVDKLDIKYIGWD